MVDYKQVKIAEEIIIVEKQEKYLVWQYRWRKERGELEELRGFGYHQAYVVDAGNKKMLESAMSWADTREYDEENDEWGDKQLSGVQHQYKNGQFELTLCDSADGSSQGGKLAFWNCIITCPDGKEFLVGINADILLELLLANTFIDGKCQNKVYLGRVAGKQVGAFTENMKLFDQAQKDEAKRQANAKAGNKYIPGDIVKTLTETEVYLGEVYCLGEQVEGDYWSQKVLNIYNTPKVRHVFVGYNDNKMRESVYTDDIKKTKPKRIIEGHIDLNGKSAYDIITKCADREIKEASSIWKDYYEQQKLSYSDSPNTTKEQQEELIRIFKSRYKYERDIKINYID